MKAKYSAPRFGVLAPDLLADHVAALIFKIHVITGWEVPNNDLYLNALQDQLRKKLTEDCADLNPSEVEYAFRQYSYRVENWGKNMNLNLFDKVINIYRAARAEVSEVEARNVLPPENQIAAPEITGEELTRYALEYYKRTGDYRLLPAECYDYLTAAGYLKITDAEKRDMIKAVQVMVDNKLLTDAEFKKDFKELRDKKEWYRATAKRMIVANYFKKQINSTNGKQD